MEDISNEVMDVVRGYARSDELRLKMLTTIGNEHWRLWADEEIRRRATGILTVLDNQALEAIADGAVDFQALCQKAFAELHQT